jgi:cysteine desulfurase
MFGLKKTINKRVYMDHASGTACSEKVFTEMKPFFMDNFYNPGGIYAEALKARQIIEESRGTVADILKSRPEEIIFVDGATEANNMAIIGSVRVWQKKNPNKRPHVITTVIEHAAVLEACKYLERESVDVTYLDVDASGIISLKELKASLTENTVLISVGYVNGEIGTIIDVRAIMKTIRNYRKVNSTFYPYVHSDAVQAINYVHEIGVPQLGIDLMTINASKIYGPKKIAVLYIRNKVKINSIVFGGNQESGLRSGTENVPYIVGFAAALRETRTLQKSEYERLSFLQKYAEEKIINIFPGLRINSRAANKIPNIINITFPNISHEEVIIRLDAKGIMASVKSACKAGEDGDSHVIRSITEDDLETGSIRFSFGRLTTKEDIDFMIKQLKKIIEEMNHVYKKYLS